MNDPPLEYVAMLAVTVLVWAIAIFAVGTVSAMFYEGFRRWRNNRRSGVMLTWDEYKEFLDWQRSRPR